MPPFQQFTTKAKEAIRRAHEVAVERGQSHVSPLHLLSALLLQEESIVMSILEKLEVDTVLLTDSILESLEGTPAASTFRRPISFISRRISPKFWKIPPRSRKFSKMNSFRPNICSFL